MNALEKYVGDYLSRELNEVRNSPNASVEDKLSLEERVVIYKYTEDGYQQLNEDLRDKNGQNDGAFGRFLDATLEKLPDYEDIVYRAAVLTNDELQKYIDAFIKNAILVEPTFISASKSKLIAYQFSGNCLFRIICRTGKNIEQFAKYGIYHPQNEKEVLFKPNCKFKVLEITNQKQFAFISMEEIK